MIVMPHLLTTLPASAVSPHVCVYSVLPRVIAVARRPQSAANMPHSFGYRARTRSMFSRGFKQHGMIKLTGPLSAC